MSIPQAVELNDEERLDPAAAERVPSAGPRIVGSPLAANGNGRPQASAGQSSPSQSSPSQGSAGQASAGQGNFRQLMSALPLGRALPGSQAAERPNGLQRAAGALRTALPFVQRLLPLLDGNLGTAVSNILAPHPQASAAPAANLAPLEDGLTDLQTQHQELRSQLAEQNTSLKRVEDRLEMVRQATDRNTLEQQELLEDLKAFSNKAIVFAVAASVLLGISIVFNVILYLHLQRVLP